MSDNYTGIYVGGCARTFLFSEEKGQLGLFCSPDCTGAIRKSNGEETGYRIDFVGRVYFQRELTDFHFCNGRLYGPSKALPGII